MRLHSLGEDNVLEAGCEPKGLEPGYVRVEENQGWAEQEEMTG